MGDFFRGGDTVAGTAQKGLELLIYAKRALHHYEYHSFFY